jgi:hypothetical protein
MPLVDNSQTVSSLVPYKLKIITRPTKEDNNNATEGCRILTQIPQNDLKVMKFKKITIKTKDGPKHIDVKDHLKTVVESIKEKHESKSWVVREWENFYDEFPNNADEYCERANTAYRIPFPSIFRKEMGLFTEGKPSEWASRCSKNLFDMSSMIKAETAATVKWGPDMTATGTRSGFPTYGAKQEDHPRVFPNYEEQGLYKNHIIPGDKDNYKSTAYTSWKKVNLVKEIKERNLKCNKSSNNAILIDILVKSDQTRKEQLQDKVGKENIESSEAESEFVYNENNDEIEVPSEDDIEGINSINSESVDYWSFKKTKKPEKSSISRSRRKKASNTSSVINNNLAVNSVSASHNSNNKRTKSTIKIQDDCINNHPSSEKNNISLESLSHEKPKRKKRQVHDKTIESKKGGTLVKLNGAGQG